MKKIACITFMMVLFCAGYVFADGSSWETNIKRSTDSQTIDAITEITSSVTTQEIIPSSFDGGLVTVGLTATEITFTGSTQHIMLTSGATNTDVIYIGGSGVTITGANAITVLKDAGDIIQFDYDDSDTALYAISGTTAGQYLFKGATLR